MSQSLLAMSVAQGTAYEVAMNEFKFLHFGEKGLTSIGTANLNGCSAVMVVSNFGAILGHIAPLPDDYANNPNAGDEHAQSKMDLLNTLYTSNQQYFPSGSGGWVVCAVFEGDVALPDQQSIFRGALDKSGFPCSLKAYNVAATRSQIKSFPGQGTVFIQGNGSTPVVYIEDVNVSRVPAGGGTSGYTAGYSLAPGQWTSSSSTLITPYPQSASTYKSTSAPFEKPYYFVQDQTYYYCAKGASTALSRRPKNEWVFNEKGWSDTNWTNKWRYWDGRNVSYG